VVSYSNPAKNDVKYIFINGVQDSNTASVSGQEWSDTSRHLFIGEHDIDSNYVNGNGWSQYFDGSISNVKNLQSFYFRFRN